MSYRLDLDEYTEIQLLEELSKRLQAREWSDCDYCGRHVDTSECKMHWRHKSSWLGYEKADKAVYEALAKTVKELLP
jgi:hypothetical protein